HYFHLKLSLQTITDSRSLPRLAVRPGALWFGLGGSQSCLVPHREAVGAKKKRAFLDVSRAGGDTRVGNSQESFRVHCRDLQVIKSLSLQSRHDSRSEEHTSELQSR